MGEGLKERWEGRRKQVVQLSGLEQLEEEEMLGEVVLEVVEVEEALEEVEVWEHQRPTGLVLGLLGSTLVTLTVMNC